MALQDYGGKQSTPGLLANEISEMSVVSLNDSSKATQSTKDEAIA